MKVTGIVLVFLLCVSPLASQDDATLRQSIDAKLAPRALLLTGGDLDSPSGRYMISFPPPNNCLMLGPVSARSRSFALYAAVSRGGFTLKHSDAALTVWTIEEWEALKKDDWYPEFAKMQEKLCGPGGITTVQ